MGRRGELTLGGGGYAQPVAGGQGDGFSVDDGRAFPGQHAVNFLVGLVGVHKGHPRPGGQLIYADFRAGQRQFIVKLHASFVADVDFRVVCHD